MPEFTREQQRVIAHERGNLLVSAAAGSGKTAVLVERILRLVHQGADIASFLVVTFTRAAAEELSQRLMDKMEEEAQDDERMKEQVQRVPLASISTIHAFCLNLLCRMSEKAGTEPNVRTCSEAERVILQTRAMEETLNAAYQDDETACRLEKIGNLKQVQCNMESLYRFLMNQPDPRGWLKTYTEKAAMGKEELSAAPWLTAASADAQKNVELVLEGIDRALRFAQDSLCDDCRAMAGLIAQDAMTCAQYAHGERTDWELGRWKSPNKRGEAASADLEALQDMRDEYKKAFQAACGARFVVDDTTFARCDAMKEPARTLSEMTLRYLNAYEALKADMGVMDFNDLEQKTLLLTREESVCAELREKYDYIFVDEYQDSSAVQETILSRISRGDNLFHVGDVKQSIYGFRQSDPELFLREMEQYGQGKGGQLIALNRNFRSLPNVLHCVNRVFETCMTKETADMDYDDAARLYPGRAGSGHDPATILQLIDLTAEPEEEQADAPGESEAVARLIEQLLGTQITGADGKARPARYADMVVLRRSVQSVLKDYLDCFSRHGIPVFSTKGGSFFDTPEITQALDVLWAIHNPLEDVHLLGALCGIGGFSAEEVARIRLYGRGEGAQEKRMWACCAAYASERDDELARRLRAFMEKLKRLRVTAREESLQILCAVMLEEMGFFARYAALPKGRTRVANLRSLPVRAAEYDEGGLRLGDFLRRIADTEGTYHEEDVPAFSENDDVVRIMTVHQSKGLEFPIVIGVGLGTGFSFKNDKSGSDDYVTSRVWTDKDMGFGLEYYDAENAASDETLFTRAVKARRRHKSIAEEMRILYVMLTRARERLVLVGAVKNLPERIKKWPLRKGEATCMLDWIMPAVLTHPDAQNINAQFGIAPPLRDYASRWEIRVNTESALEQPPQAQEAPQTELPQEDGAWITAQLSYVYPYAGQEIERKRSVSQLAHGEEENFFIMQRPAFLSRQKKLEGAARGSALHRFMELVRFAGLKDAPDLRAALLEQVEEQTARENLTPEQAEAVRGSLEEILGFFACPIGQAIVAGTPVLREKPFEMAMEENGEISLVQGIIDLMVLEKDGAVLVDYKTDHTGTQPDEVRLKHGRQVALYRRAARQAGLTVKKSVVYLFYTHACVEIEDEE